VTRAVAVFGRQTEAPCALLLQALQQQGTPVHVLDPTVGKRAQTHWGLDAHGQLHGQVLVDGRQVDLKDIGGLYLRPVDDRRLGLGQGAALLSAQAWTQAWIEIGELAPWRVVNRLSSMASNGSKPLQSHCLAAAGFHVPPMLQSNDPEAVLAFEAEHGPLIYKSASGVRSIVRTLDADARARLQAVRVTPTLFQKRLRGTNIRVHVIADEVFATEIDSEALDYRYPGHVSADLLTDAIGDAGHSGVTALRATRLPLDVQARCVAATLSLGLAFAGLDLMLADDGCVYCFEANPSPGYSYYEEATGQPIAAALARHLAGD